MECAACSEPDSGVVASMVYETEDHLRCHIAVDHVFWVPFECVLCPRTLLPTETVLKQHYEQLHPKNVPKATYTYIEEKQLEIRRIIESSKQALAKPLTFDSQAIESSEATDCEAHTAHFTTSQIPNGQRFVKTLNLDLSIEEHSAERFETDANTTVPSGDDSYIGMQAANPEIQHHLPKIEASDEMNATEPPQKNTNDQMAKSTCHLCGEVLASDSDQVRKRHVWHRHMSEAPLQCRQCSWRLYDMNHARRASQKHIQKAHPEHSELSPAETLKDNRKELGEVFTQTFQRAFSSSSQPANHRPSIHQNNQKQRVARPRRSRISLPSTESNSKRRTCQICERSVLAGNSGQHIWSLHLPQERYYCLLCDYKTSSLQLMKQRHVTPVHGEVKQEKCWGDDTVKMLPDFRTAFHDAFGCYFVGRSRTPKAKRAARRVGD